MRLAPFFCLLMLLPAAVPAQGTIRNSKAIEGAGATGTIDSELLYQVRFGQAEDVRLLLSRGANPAQVNEIGWPLVSIAATRSDGLGVPILRELIKSGADINQGGPSRMFPVIAAARRGDDALMDFLLYEAFADFDVQDANGVKVAEIARANGHAEMAGKMKAIEEERGRAVRMMSSPERRDELERGLITTSCGREYLSFYYKSKQDRFTEAEMSESLDLKHSELSVITNDLIQVFHYPPAGISGLGSAAAIAVKNELIGYVSNRNRRAHGVGAKGDMEKRCNRIADKILADTQAAADATAARKTNKKNRRDRLGW